MKETGLSVVLSSEKGAVRKTYEGSKQTERRVAAELKEKMEEEGWQSEKRAIEDKWEAQRVDHERRNRNTWEWVRAEEKAKKDAEKAKVRREEEEEERDNIIETRYETEEDYGPLQPLPPHPATITSASLDGARVSTSEEEEEEEEEEAKEEKKRPKGRASKIKGKKTKGLSIKAPSYAQVVRDNEVLKKRLAERDDKKKAEKKRKEKTSKNSNKSASEKSLRKPSPASDDASDYVDSVSDSILASPPSKYVAKPRQESPMDAE